MVNSKAREEIKAYWIWLEGYIEAAVYQPELELLLPELATVLAHTVRLLRNSPPVSHQMMTFQKSR